MSVSLIIVGVVALALLVLVIASKVINVLTGLLATVGGIFAYFWLQTTESWTIQLKIALEFKITPDELRTYSLIAIGVGVVLLLIGVLRGRKTQKIVVVQQQTPVKPVEEIKEKNEIKKPEAKVEEIKEEKQEEVKETVQEEKNEAKKTENKEENKEDKETKTE